MKRLSFPNPFLHTHPAVVDINEILDEQASTGERAADWIATAVGSWRFIIGQSIVLGVWALLNVTVEVAQSRLSRKFNSRQAALLF